MFTAEIRRHAASLALLCLCVALRADEDGVPSQKGTATAQPAPTRGSQMLHGPVLACSVQLPSGAQPRAVASKGLVIRLTAGDEASVCFDTDTLRLAAGWVDGFVSLKGTNLGSYKGEGTGAVETGGKLHFRTENEPGWSTSSSFIDPRPGKAGPLPKAAGRFKGFYLHDLRVILSYEVAGCAILESVEHAKVDGQAVWIRRFTAEAAAVPLHLHPLAGAAGDLAVSTFGDVFTADPAAVPAAGGTGVVVPPHAASPAPSPAALVAAVDAPLDLTTLCGGNAPRWPQTVETTGILGKDDAAYVLDTIPLPEENPWLSWMRVSAFDFFPDGRAAIATLNGDVWLASGLDTGLAAVTWKRYAVGLYEPLGLRVVGGDIFVLGRDQITRLRDVNADGEADFYECFNHDRALAPSYHAFAFDLQTDSRGNFYYVVGGNQLGARREWHAAVFRVTPDGGTTEAVATGFRAPNGMAIGPRDEIVVSDNQGHWIPSSKINLVQPGGFYGHVADPRLDPKAVAPPGFDPPLCWIPMAMDNSSGGQVWAPGEKWGPYSGHLLHTSYGKSALLAVLSETVQGVAQAGVVALPLKFASGAMRARFSPADGQLYVAGLRGWQSNAGKDGCFQRVRYTGQPLRLPTGLRVGKDSLAITFGVELDAASARDAGNYAIHQYNYQWSSAYGSPELSVARPGAKGRDPVEATAAALSPDGKTVTLTIPGLQPVMQMEIKFRLQDADGSDVTAMIANTIHKVPDE